MRWAMSRYAFLRLRPTWMSGNVRMHSSARGPFPFFSSTGHGCFKAKPGLNGDQHLVEGVGKFQPDGIPTLLGCRSNEEIRYEVRQYNNGEAKENGTGVQNRKICDGEPILGVVVCRAP